VTVDLDSLLGHPGGVGGELGGAWPLAPEACRRLACDGAATRVLVTRHPAHQHPDHGAGPGHGPEHHDHPGTDDTLAAQLQAAATRLPATLGGAPTQPLEVGRTSRVVTAAQRAALVVRDGGCAVAGCQRPPAWCEAHHLRHWLHGGPTDLANLALVCRAHHRAVHEGGWRLTRHPDGRLAAIPPHRKQRAAA
jgi:HNH endonuclease